MRVAAPTVLKNLLDRLKPITSTVPALFALLDRPGYDSVAVTHVRHALKEWVVCHVCGLGGRLEHLVATGRNWRCVGPPPLLCNVPLHPREEQVSSCVLRWTLKAIFNPRRWCVPLRTI